MIYSLNMQIFQGNRQNQRFFKTDLRIAQLIAVYFQNSKVFNASFQNRNHFMRCCRNTDFFHSDNFLTFFKAHIRYTHFFMPKFRIELCLFETIGIKFSENSFLCELIEWWKNCGSMWKMLKEGRNPKKNFINSLDRSSTNSICHPRPNFQCWPIQSNLKSETDIAYTKLKNAADNSRK